MQTQVSLVLLLSLLAMPIHAQTDDAPKIFKQSILPFMNKHCFSCHNDKKQEGDVAFHELKGDFSNELTLWSSIHDRINAGEMPPEKQPRPAQADIDTVLSWIKQSLAQERNPFLKMPRRGNLVPHEQLFGKAATETIPPPVRLWRLRPEAYDVLINDVANTKLEGISQPFSTIGDRGFKDYSDLYSIDNATVEILLRNAQRVVDAQTAYEMKEGKIEWKNNTVKEFKPLFENVSPTHEQLETAFKAQVKRVVRTETVAAEELQSYISLYERNLQVSDRAGAARATLVAILLRADAILRFELGGEPDVQGRRMLQPQELAQAITLALTNYRDHALFEAMNKGKLSTRDEVAEHVKRLLDKELHAQSRIMQFFREYFEYQLAIDVFKDRPKLIVHQPQVLINDTDRLVKYIVDQDKDVLHELLTTRKSFVNCNSGQNKQTRKEELKRAFVPNAHNDRGLKPLEAMYGFEDWPADQPVELEDRIGILMQPSWLIAHSTNFDNDVVRRGRWIRERLLGGNVPDLPIGVAAQIPEDKDITLRDRMHVTKAENCWRCHQKMDDLGFPFEQFNHYGNHRTRETVLNIAETEANVDKKGNSLGEITQDLALDTTGLLADCGDDKLHGPVKNPYELMHRLAESDRVRQVFIRHVFRFFLGRNETPHDAATLQQADRVYLSSNGSFKALLTSLLTSDSFLYRRSGSLSNNLTK